MNEEPLIRASTKKQGSLLSSELTQEVSSSDEEDEASPEKKEPSKRKQDLLNELESTEQKEDKTRGSMALPDAPFKTQISMTDQ